MPLFLGSSRDYLGAASGREIDDHNSFYAAVPKNPANIFSVMD